ncbi:MAG: hypothetical protein LBC51_03965, partial [Treponema sp.]|nr:hypothetical protein [Treponema sp.]
MSTLDKKVFEKVMDPFLVILFSFIWSSAFIAGAFSLPYLGPYLTLLLRFALSAVLLFLLVSSLYLNCGYRRFSLMRASAVVNRQLILRASWLRLLFH